MKIYFAGSIFGGRSHQPVYLAIINALKENGHIVLSEHVASATVLQDESSLTPKEIFEQDIAWIDRADAVIADVTVPSLGVGYEVCYALQKLKPTLCIYQDGARLSAMIAGNSSKGINVVSYDRADSAIKQVNDFLANDVIGK